ncbi:MAG TPA: Hpt domain-containing protein [Edaphobacter sp.]|nr:Hpt domain-containing protein [Edaphobacter sp.]
MNPTSTHSDPEIHALLQELWQRHLPSTRERLEVLENAVRDSAEGKLDETHRAEAQSAAHKLSGNLGMFGHKQAGEIAGEIEHLFKASGPDKVSRLNSLMQELRELLAPHM